MENTEVWAEMLKTGQRWYREEPSGIGIPLMGMISPSVPQTRNPPAQTFQGQCSFDIILIFQ